MKTAISLPDDLFRLAESKAKQLHLSRSQLYATALAEFLHRGRSGAVTERLNSVYSGQAAKLDPALHRAQIQSIDDERW